MFLDVFAAGNPGVLLMFGLVSGPALVLAGAMRERWMTWSYGAMWLVAIVLFMTPWHPRKRFANDLRSITTGMTLEQVRSCLERYQLRVDSDGPNLRHGGGDRELDYAWTSDGGYDADIGCVTLEAGRVLRVEFLRD